MASRLLALGRQRAKATGRTSPDSSDLDWAFAQMKPGEEKVFELGFKDFDAGMAGKGKRTVMAKKKTAAKKAPKSGSARAAKAKAPVRVRAKRVAQRAGAAVKRGARRAGGFAMVLGSQAKQLVARGEPGKAKRRKAAGYAAEKTSDILISEGTSLGSHFITTELDMRFPTAIGPFKPGTWLTIVEGLATIFAPKKWLGGKVRHGARKAFDGSLHAKLAELLHARGIDGGPGPSATP